MPARLSGRGKAGDYRTRSATWRSFSMVLHLTLGALAALALIPEVVAATAMLER